MAWLTLPPSVTRKCHGQVPPGTVIMTLFFSSKIYPYLLYVCGCFVCVDVHISCVHAAHPEAKRGHQSLWNWSCEPPHGCSGRTASALYDQISLQMSLPPAWGFLLYFQTQDLILACSLQHIVNRPNSAFPLLFFFFFDIYFVVCVMQGKRRAHMEVRGQV